MEFPGHPRHDGDMTEAPPNAGPAPTAGPPRVLRRSSDGRMITGVAAGLGQYTGIDPVVFRVGFAVLVFGSGIGLFLYAAAFLLMKETNGGPGYVEQWTGRDFAPEAVFALLTGVAGFGLAINLATVWLGTGTLVVGTLLALALLTAHARGVDLRAVARSLPEGLNRRPSAPPPDLSAPPAPYPFGRDFTGPTRPDPARATPTAPPRQATSWVTPPRETPRPTPHDTAPPAAASAETTIHETTADERAAAETSVHEKLSSANQDNATRIDATLADAPQSDTARREYPSAMPSYAHSEPFAPHGPYQPLDPRRRGGQSPYDLRPYPEQVRPPRVRRRRSFIGVITMVLAIIIGGIVVAVQATPGSVPNFTAAGGAMLITIGAGLLVAAWWGRGAGLVAAGTVIALTIGLGMMFGSVPTKIGSPTWQPTSVGEARKHYEVGIGDGTLDLSELILAPGTRVTFNTSISVGELTVIVPPTVRVEVHATAKVGDIKIDQSVRGGTDLDIEKVLEPDVTPEGKVSTIELNIKGGIGDVEVRRAA